MRSAPRLLMGGTVLGLAVMMMGCAPQLQGPPVAEVAPQAREEHGTLPSPDSQQVIGTTGPQRVRPSGSRELGRASYYGPEFTGRRMANGRRFDPRSTSVAHRTLPFGTTVLVRNLGNGRVITATVEDRGPFIQGRIIDLSPRLAEHLGMIRQGVAPVEVMPVELAEAPEPRR